MTRHRWIWVILALLAFGGGTWFWCEVVSPRIWPYDEDADLIPGADPHPDSEKSADLPSDLKLMRETQPLGGPPDPSHGPNPRSSSDRAINAASRVFNTVKLLGKTHDEVMTLLGDPKSLNDSIYNFPRFRAAKGALVYRFDNGACGWQFNVEFDDDGYVREVQRQWIP